MCIRDRIRERCKGVHCVDFGESFPTSIYLQNLASIQPRMSLAKFARSPRAQIPQARHHRDVPRRLRGLGRARGAGGRRSRRAVRGPHQEEVRGLGSAKLANFAKFCKFLAGSFSAVSKRNFARKYAFDSIFQALQDLHTFAPLQS